MIRRRGRRHAVASAALALVLGVTRSEAAELAASGADTAGSAGAGTAEAKDAIWGYTVLNDVTLRGLHPQLGPTLKAFESSAPLGPYLVPRRFVPDPHAVGLKMRLDGREIQDGNTRDMRFDLFESLAELSKWHTLAPGDVIATGDIGSRENLPPGSMVLQFFGGTSLLILVGVVLDIMRQVETHLLQRHYDGFLRKGKIKGRYDRLAQTGNAASSTALVYLWAVIGLLVVVAAAAWIAKA